MARLTELVADPEELADLGGRFGRRARELYGEAEMGRQLTALLDPAR